MLIATGDPDNIFGPLFTCQSAQGGSNSAKWCYAPFDKHLFWQVDLK